MPVQGLRPQVPGPRVPAGHHEWRHTDQLAGVDDHPLVADKAVETAKKAAKEQENIWANKFMLYCKEALAALADLWLAAGLLDSEVVRRHRMLRDYRAHCAGQGAAPASLPGMQAVILLSQLLARPAAQAVDLHWVLGAAGRRGRGTRGLLRTSSAL